MPEDEHHHDEDLTTSTMERWEWIGTILAGAIILTLPVLLIGAGAGYISLGAVPQAWFVLYATIALMAATWSFGKETLKAVKKAQGS
jgi:sterol desaturase/sphingolipid hydroxylase (fatty acid hydroxylase superfamily)